MDESKHIPEISKGNYIDNMEKTWGEKTLKEVGVNVDINTRLLVKKVKDDISSYFESENFINSKATPDVKDRAKEVISNYLESLEGRKAIDPDYKVDAGYHYHRWKELYPKLSTRILARATSIFQKRFNLFHNGEVFKWYHFVLPFKITDEIVFHSEEMEEVWEYISDGEAYLASDKLFWIMENIKKYFIHNKWAKLIVPWESLDVNLFIKPVKPIEYIKVDFVGPKMGEGV